MNESFKTKLHRGDLLVGTIQTLPSPEITEILCSAGFDWLFIDLEHSTLNSKDAQNILQTASPLTPCMVRVPSIDETWIKKALDAGASGIIVPQVSTAEAAEQAVRLCKYPPEGVRSVGVARAQGYGEKFQEYIDSANKETAVIIQIEHIDAVNNIDTIVEISGIDCLFIGPYDLSASMGKPGCIGDPDVQKAISLVKEYAERVGIPLGIFGPTVESVKPYIDMGYTLIAVGMDTMILGSAVKGILAQLR
ncbi:MAG: 2,4-dihydroxyhept-2-ene-1,7-dioic acid aldolase [Bacteroidetes bacterium]|nr:2,4-dihydroxyhept-2-ene-1,7-dioic acid aldolase [Bacteroidota bacterium]